MPECLPHSDVLNVKQNIGGIGTNKIKMKEGDNEMALKPQGLKATPKLNAGLKPTIAPTPAPEPELPLETAEEAPAPPKPRLGKDATAKLKTTLKGPAVATVEEIKEVEAKAPAFKCEAALLKENMIEMQKTLTQLLDAVNALSGDILKLADNMTAAPVKDMPDAETTEKVRKELSAIEEAIPLSDPNIKAYIQEVRAVYPDFTKEMLVTIASAMGQYDPEDEMIIPVS